MFVETLAIAAAVATVAPSAFAQTAAAPSMTKGNPVCSATCHPMQPGLGLRSPLTILSHVS
jgi:hypothetical protein